MTLVIMAAGMGSRFGGLKQIEPVGPNGEFIIDYSIYDAILSGFDKVVFIIKEENYEIFKNTIGNRIESSIAVEYVFQNNNNVPKDIYIPKERVKPLGTGHAILCCKDYIKEDFVIINADDFYGREAFKEIANFLKNKDVNDFNKYAMVGYEVKNTLTLNGSVKRGVCETENSYLTKITESSISYQEDKIFVQPLNGSEPYFTDKDTLVSMNMIAFTPYLFEELNKEFPIFLKNNDLMTCEYLIPDVLFKQIREEKVSCKVLHTNAVWKGITYNSDLSELKEYIKLQVELGIYPSNLY